MYFFVKFKSFSDEAQDALLNYHWPGNVRELQNFVKRIVVLCKDHVISLNDIKLEVAEKVSGFEAINNQNSKAEKFSIVVTITRFTL